ncbi:hypothetical protein C0993_001608, partial [Termitomyces sp. T159_Od127]
MIDDWWVDSGGIFSQVWACHFPYSQFYLFTCILIGCSDILHQILWHNVDQEVIEHCRKLLLGDDFECINVPIESDPRICHASLRERINPATLWSFLVHTGYLTVKEPALSSTVANLRIPSFETHALWSSWLIRPFRERYMAGPDMLMELLHKGDQDGFSALLQVYLQDVSHFENSEKRDGLQHFWMLGISVELQRRRWKVCSNYKSGNARLDMTIQLDHDPKALVFEIKHLNADENKEKVSAKVEEGFQQIADENYCQRLDNYISSAEI